MPAPLAVGDRVKFKRDWLKSTGQTTGDVPFARGTIKEIKVREHSADTAMVDFPTLKDEPMRVLVANITHEKDPETSSY